VNEKTFAHQIEFLLDLGGWRWCHYEPAVRQSGAWATPLRGDKGEPDYRAVRDGRLIFVEIKGDGGRLSAYQRDWIADLSEVAGVETYVWHPDNLDQAKEILR
jgi:hypothetical protein